MSKYGEERTHDWIDKNKHNNLKSVLHTIVT